MTDNDGSEFSELERHLWDTLILMGDKLEKATAERDEATEQLQQAKAQKLQAVKVLVGADECCDECRVTSENEARSTVTVSELEEITFADGSPGFEGRIDAVRSEQRRIVLLNASKEIVHWVEGSIYSLAKREADLINPTTGSAYEWVSENCRPVGYGDGVSYVEHKNKFYFMA